MRRIFILLAVVLLYSGCTSHKNLENSSTGGTSMKSDTTKPSEIVKLPVFIPAIELQNQLYQQYFQPTYGKYFPCSGGDCDPAYKDLYLENPFIHIKDSLVTIKMHLAGTAHMLLSLPVSGDILLTAKPEVKNDTLYFRHVTMQPSSQNIILAITTSFFGKDIVKKIQDRAWFSFRPKLDAERDELRKSFPVKWGNIYLLLDLKRIYLNDVHTQSTPTEGIIADFAAELSIEKMDFINGQKK